MKLSRSIIALACALFISPALAQTNQGSSPLTGRKGGTNNAFMQFTGPASSMKTYTLPNASDTICTLNAPQGFTAAKTFSDLTLLLAGSSSGTTTLKASATASGTLTLPAATDTLLGRATTDTLTNKTLDTAAAGNSLKINGLAATDNTGTGKVVRDTSPTLVTPTLGAATATSINKVAITAPAAGATLTIPDGVTVTAPAATDTLVGRNSTDTLTNKTISGSSNTITNVPASALGVMTGDTGTGGAKGAVPAPGAGDAAAGKYLDAGGGWSVPAGGGGGGGMTDVERQNAALALIYQSKSFGIYRRVVNQFATGWKGSTDSDYGINTGSSSNYVVTPGSAGAITGYVAPTSTPGTSQVPTMTSNTAPSGVASSSPSLNNGQPYQAFDGISNSVFWNVGNLPGIIQYQFTSGKVIQSYVIRLDSSTGDTVPVGGWKSWTFDGSNDGSSWTTLDTRSGVTLAGDTDNSFSFSNSTSYTYYRWRVTTGGSSRATITELKMVGPPTINNATIVTASQTADASVSNARVLLEYDNGASPTLNSDLTAEVTCDGGSNWASATLSAVTSSSQAGRKVVETADTSCTSGTSFAARIKTANGKDVKVYGASVTVH